MVKNWRTTKFAFMASAAALVFCAGTAAADSGGTGPHPTTGWHHAPLHHPAFPQGAFGPVSSVNGDATAGACGTAGATGSFVVTGWKSTVTTVDVTSTTTFAGSLDAPPTFANVCVGKLVGAVGAVSGDTVTAAKVFVIRARTAPTQRGAFGTVTSVNGVTTAGACGTAATPGTFTLTAWKSTGATVDVTATTAFTDPSADPPTFADVCVGSLVGAIGTVTSAPTSNDPATGETVTASKVCVVPAMATPVPTGATTPETPATGATAASTTASTDPAHGVVSQPGRWGSGPAVDGHTTVPAPAHGFAPSGSGTPGRFGSGTPGNSDTHGGFGDGNSGAAPSGGFSGQDHGRS
jgi:hypothetical protein